MGQGGTRFRRYFGLILPKRNWTSLTGLRVQRPDQVALKIANALSLAPSTVRNQIVICYRKLGVVNKVELALRIARQAPQ